MRIAQVVCSLECSGAERIVADLSLALARRGHEVDFLTIDRLTGEEFEKEELRRFERGGVRHHSFGRRVGSRSQALVSSFRFWARNLRRKYDVLHSHLSMPDAIACLVRLCTPWALRHFVTIHSTRQRWDAVTSRLLRRRSIVYSCEPIASRFRPVFGDRRIVRNGVDLPRFGFDDSRRSRARRLLSCDSGSRLVVSLSRLHEGKNVATALRAVGILRAQRPDLNARFLVCGDGRERENLDRLARDLAIQDQVEFLGVRTDVADILHAADVFVSASLYEGMPMAALEALASGLPCALSPIPEHEDVTRGVAGCFLAADPTPGAFAQAIGAALDMTLSREALLDSRREFLRGISIDRVAAEYEDAYETV
ncbi:glycosyltransferase [Candidatus Sumerlaeota bacterium]|nr:glycosyltransferase [Candidatus Sumerlaeota bacterium]